MADSWNKKEREKKKQQKKKEKEEKKQTRKDQPGGSDDDMIAYLDEDGNLSSKPPDPSKKRVFQAEDMQIGVPKALPEDPADLLRKGVVRFFNEGKGFGFIRDTATGDSVFVHSNALTEAIQENDNVTFEVEMGPRGANAIRVTLIK